MFLKSIEVQGFKSFANRMVFEFKQGITGIVGPNGSGKSNVADAVRWVLGEQSAKQLRGSRMEDVIFAGTENRKKLGFAYVAITLDNADHKLPVDYDTVTVSRRVFRSGESEYKINGHSCRLKDIQELFFDTGIGKEGYSIIGQGQIDKILSGKPEERRELFDEAVGIVKYKKRKALTEKNLDAEKQNLSRLKDILYELEQQIGPLMQQNETARKYLDLREQLKICDTSMFVATFNKLKSDAAQVTEKIDTAQTQMAQANAEYEQIKTVYAEAEAAVEAYDQEISDRQQKISDAAVERQRIDGELELIGSQLESIGIQKEELSRQIRETEEKISGKKADIENYQKQLIQLMDEKKHLSASGEDSKSTLDAVSADIAAISSGIDEANSEIIRLLNLASEDKGNLRRYETMAEQDQQRLVSLEEQLSLLQEKEAKESDLVKAFEKENDEIQEEKRKLSREKAKLERQGADIQLSLNELREKLNKEERHYHETNSRYQTLKNITERYEGYGGSIRRVMEQKNREKGIIGVVADIIQVDKKFELAIETALGGSISNIVVDDEKTARKMIDYLKTNRFGRATFLPLTSVQGRKQDDMASLLKEKGVIGAASDLIQTHDKFKAIARFLLGRIIVVDNIDHALALARKNHYSLRIVTLDGEQLHPGGSLSGGAYKNNSSLLSRRREIEELTKEADKSKKQLGILQQKIDQQQEEKRANREALDKNIKAENALFLRENTVGIRKKQVSDSQQSHERSVNELMENRLQLKGQIEEIHELVQELTEKIRKTEERQEQVNEKLQEMTQALHTADEHEKVLQEKASDLRVRHSEIDQQIGFNQDNLEKTKEEISNMTLQLNEARGRILALDEQENAQHLLKDEKTKAAALIDQQTASEKKELSEVQEVKARYTAEQKTFFDKREAVSETISALDKELFRLKNQREKLENERSQMGTYMWEEYQLTYQSALSWVADNYLDLPAAKLKKMINDLKSQIHALGHVNVNAIEEYKAVSERYETMKKQSDDIEKAEKQLETIISQLGTAMRKQFNEQFALIQKEFDRVFKKLFGGGVGTLSLSDPDDLLETGIIITAQPPGKKLQNMMQLSGGEKALAAIALLFAIQNLKPSPFCLLDEIEAALDDANVVRYAQYLHNLTKDTQFIVITHRRGTMKAADVLYGITMQEKGVSTLVSVNLIENQLTS